MQLTHIGGPTVLIEIDGVRILTDPTFDEPGLAYDGLPLQKTAGPALSLESLGRIDAVLLSHDQHADNLDTSGRALLARVPHVFTTGEGAERLGSGTVGLAPYESADLLGDGRIRITATPARHGPEGSLPLVGHVIGFVVESAELAGPLYISGDTVFYEELATIGKRFAIDTAILHLGDVHMPNGGPKLTMSAADAVKLSEILHARTIVPIHYEGWAHFSESREVEEAAFATIAPPCVLRRLTLGISETFSGDASVRLT